MIFICQTDDVFQPELLKRRSYGSYADKSGKNIVKICGFFKYSCLTILLLMLKYIVCGYISPTSRKIETKSLFFQYLHLGGMFKMAKWVYMFTEGDASMRNTLGGKGANLAEMTKLGLPVPQGFTITTDACTQYYEDGRKINDEIMEQFM